MSRGGTGGTPRPEIHCIERAGMEMYREKVRVQGEMIIASGDTLYAYDLRNQQPLFPVERPQYAPGPRDDCRGRIHGCLLCYGTKRCGKKVGSHGSRNAYSQDKTRAPRTIGRLSSSGTRTEPKASMVYPWWWEFPGVSG